MLSKKQFELLRLLLKDNSMSQREMSNELDCSVGTINSTLKNLIDLGYFKDNQVTELGLKELEPYKVKRAIFLAAGFGSRLMPITINTPKPLIRVNGIRIIDRLIDSVLEAGINEIIIVRGHLKDEFDQLLIKYPMIKFIDNSLYNEGNNIISALLVKDMFENAYVFDADIYMQNKTLIHKYEYQTFMYGVATPRIDDWCLNCDKKGIITSILFGGIDAYKEVGISYWTSEDGKKLKTDLEDVYNSPGGKERFWELVPLHYKKKNYKVQIKECNVDDVIEINTFNELKNIDKAYC